MRREVGAINEAQILIIPPPPIRGIGRGGGFKMYVQDRSGAGMKKLDQVTETMLAKANAATRTWRRCSRICG